MTGFANPFKPRGGAGYAEALQRIRAWMEAALPAGAEGRDPTISITELACAEPGCPPRETVILVMWPDAPTWKLRIHKAMPDVGQGDVLGAMAARETIR